MSSVSQGNLAVPYEFGVLPADTDMTPVNDRDNSNSWWGVFTRPEREIELARRLQSCQVSCYLPMVPTARLGGRGNVWLPLFPGYLFVFGGQGEHLSALATGFVCRILPVADQDRLRNELLDLHRVLTADIPLQRESDISSLQGERHQMDGGELAGLSGVTYRNGQETRFAVGIEFLGQGISIPLEELCLQLSVG